jgi:uncharacterized protein
MRLFISNELIEITDLPSRGRGLVAKRDIKKEEVIFAISGKVVTTQTRYTAPIAKGIIIDPVISDNLCTEVYYLNHSCDPSAYVRDGGLCVAMRDIRVGEEIAIHYGTLGIFGDEWNLDDRKCLCGAVTCTGWVRGYNELTSEEKIRFENFIQDWVKES